MPYRPVALEWEQTGAGETVLLIHGSPATTFRPLMDEAALASYRLIRYHRRNWAGSSRTVNAVTIGDHAADAAALLAALEVRRAQVVGHSYGALVALQLAADAPDHVGSLALLEPNLLMVPSAGAFNDQVRPAFAAYRNEQLHRWFPHLEQADVAGAGHLLPLENPAGLAAALAAFSTRHPIAVTG